MFYFLCFFCSPLGAGGGLTAGANEHTENVRMLIVSDFFPCLLNKTK